MPVISTEALQHMKQQGEKITMLTAYDASLAAHLEEAAVEVILVGDSLGMVVQGHSTTSPVTMQDMLYHTRNVARARQRALLITDMPYHSYQNQEDALQHARMLCEAGCDMVKMEGANDVVAITAALVSAGIPVCGHLGLLPQSVKDPGDYKVQGREAHAAQKMLDDALALQQAGAQMIVLECIPVALATRISDALTIPTIGIGAGVDCDGQVLVTYDLIGLTPGKRPRFSKDFLRELPAGKGITDAIRAFVEAVKLGRFPDQTHSFR